MMGRKIPHLTDVDAIREEAAKEHGALDDAATMVETWKSNLDPNLEATALKKVNVEATEKVIKSLEEDGDNSIIHEKLADELGDDHGIIPLSAAVRGHALVVVGMDQRGNPTKVVVPWDDKYQSIGLSEAEKARRAVAQYEGKSRDLGKEARAEIDRRVAEARSEIAADMRKELAKLRAEILPGGGSADATDDESEGSGSGSGSEGDSGSRDTGGSDASFPRSHKKLDALAKKNNVEFEPKSNLDVKIAKLQAAGVKPS